MSRGIQTEGVNIKVNTFAFYINSKSASFSRSVIPKDNTVIMYYLWSYQNHSCKNGREVILCNKWCIRGISDIKRSSDRGGKYKVNTIVYVITPKSASLKSIRHPRPMTVKRVER